MVKTPKVTQYIARAIYKRVAGYKAREGTLVSGALNRVLGTKDGLERLALLRGKGKVYQAARKLLDGGLGPVPSPYLRLQEIVHDMPVDAGQRGLLFNQAIALLKEAGYKMPSYPTGGVARTRR